MIVGENMPKKKKKRIHKVRGSKIIKRNSKKKNHKTLWFLIIPVFILLIITGIYIFKINMIKVTLIGDKNIILEVNSSYNEQGVTAIKNDKDISKDIKIDGKVKTNKLGEYKVKYLYKDKIYKTRTIKVIDTEKPTIALNGDSEIKLIQSSEYNELGAIALDNYDGDITNKVITTGDVDINTIGEYIITYTIRDSSNNDDSITRKINVVEKPQEIVKTIPKEENNYVPPVVVIPGKVTTASFTNSGIYIEGCATTNQVPKSIILKDKKYEVIVNGNCYKSNIDITSLSNGSYPIYLEIDISTLNIVNELEVLARINRAKINNRLVSIDYSNNNMNLIINNFSYQYDVMIDVGHGGWDSGATNAYITEKEMNLTVSLYEKSLFEQAGYKVLIIRTNDTYGSGINIGSKDLYNRAYFMGYYGVTSKIVYSNHHNANTSSTASGFEMYTTNQASDMSTEVNIFNGVGSIFKANAIYGRNYDSGQLYNKTAGNGINAKNYYAVLRIPYELFNVNNITIYEGCYLSNINDYINYWNNNLWKEISKVKVNNYIAKLKSM